MNNGAFRQAPQGYRILVVMVISLTMGLIFGMLGRSLAGTIWQFDLMSPDAEYEITEPGYMMALRLVMLFTHLGMFILTAWIGARIFAQQSIGQELYLHGKPPLRWMAALPVLMLLLFPVINFFYELNLQWNAPETVMELEEESMKITDGFMTADGFSGFLMNLLVLALIPALGEELLFRGLVQRYAIGWIRSPHAGIWFTAALFSFIHFQFLGFLPRLLLGAYFGYMVFWTGSLWPAIGLHFLNNALAVSIGWAELNGWIDSDIDAFGAKLPLVAFGCVVLFGLMNWWLLRKRQLDS
jgi:uncharacterized protein